MASSTDPVYHLYGVQGHGSNDSRDRDPQATESSL
jgi:hypothetical protein